MRSFLEGKQHRESFQNHDGTDPAPAGFLDHRRATVRDHLPLQLHDRASLYRLGLHQGGALFRHSQPERRELVQVTLSERHPQSVVKSFMRSRPFVSAIKGILERISSRFPRVSPWLTPWYFEPGLAPVPINTLVSPLRYDILVRVSFFRFFETHQDLFERDFDAFVERARQHAYFTWFTEVYSLRNPEEFESEGKVESAFRQRVMRAARLYRRFQEIGFDKSTPIILVRGCKILSTITGKRFDTPFYTWEGLHRIALMIMAGYSSLPPAVYCIRNLRKFSPIDNTHLLIRPLKITLKEYYSFLSLGYTEKEFTDKESLLANVRAKGPEKVKELEAIIAVDEQNLFKEPIRSLQVSKEGNR